MRRLIYATMASWLVHLERNRAARSPASVRRTRSSQSTAGPVLEARAGTWGIRDCELFSYWVQGNKTCFSEDLIFRYWRYQAELGKGFQEYDIDIWSEIKAAGDHQYTGCIIQPWDRIDLSLPPTHGKGVLGKEMLYYECGEAREETQLGLSHRDILVMKFHVLPHGIQKILARRISKNAKTMSRVSRSLFLEVLQVS